MVRASSALGWAFFALCVAVYAALRPTASAQLPIAAGDERWRAHAYLLQASFAGPLRGIAADLKLIEAMSIYDDIRNKRFSDSEAGWQMLLRALQDASRHDPWFADAYRLTAGLLAFHESTQRAALSLLAKGSRLRAHDPDLPFLTGFLFHLLLHDDEKAAFWMRIASERPHAHTLAPRLAAEFAAHAFGIEEAIALLESLRQRTPKHLRGPIEEKLRALRARIGRQGSNGVQ